MADDGLLGARSSKITTRTVSAALLILVILGCLYTFSHYIQNHVGTNPSWMLLFPLVAAGSIAAVLPLLMFITYQDDFKKLNPWFPADYLAISGRCYQALAKNNMKVAEKDL